MQYFFAKSLKKYKMGHACLKMKDEWSTIKENEEEVKNCREK